MFNTLEIIERVSKLLEAKVNVEVPICFSDNTKGFKVESLPRVDFSMESASIRSGKAANPLPRGNALNAPMAGLRG